MRNLIILQLFLLAYGTARAQVKTKEISSFFYNFNVGTEYKRNNSDSLTSGIINYTPLVRLSFGECFKRKLYYAIAFSYNQVDLRIKDTRMIYKKFGEGFFIGLHQPYKKFSIRNQLGVQFNQYSLINLKKDNLITLDSFQYKGNYFRSKNDTYMVYGFELISKRNKKVNLMTGLQAGYAINKPTVLTQKYKERLTVQVYLGWSFII